MSLHQANELDGPEAEEYAVEHLVLAEGVLVWRRAGGRDGLLLRQPDDRALAAVR